MSPTFEIKEEEEVKPVEKKDFKDNDKKFDSSEDSVKIQFIEKNDNLNDYITDWKDKNLIKAVFSDNLEFITTEKDFKVFEKKFNLKNVEFDVNIKAEGDKTNIPSFILEKAGISKGDKIVFEIGKDNSVRLKKV
jgi:repressor of nif and glnA expression